MTYLTHFITQNDITKQLNSIIFIQILKNYFAEMIN